MIGRRLLWSAGVGVVAAIIWLAVAAALGHDLGGPTGALVGFALVAVVGVVLARHRDPLDPWIWSHGAREGLEFPAACSPADALRSAVALAQTRRGWRLTSEDSEALRVRITVGMTPLTWQKRIEVSARPDGQGSLVTVRSGSPQLIDWGENKRTIAVLRQHIQGPAQTRT